MTKARDLANASTALSAVSATELAFVDGVTSAIQTQLDAKTAKSTLTTTGDIYYASSASTPARLGIGSTDQILKVTGGIPAWATPASSNPASATSFVSTEQTTTSSTFVNLATTQSVTVTTGTKALIAITTITHNDTLNNQNYISFAVTGASSISEGNGNNTIYYRQAGVGGYQYFSTISGTFYLTGLTAGSNTFTLKFASGYPYNTAAFSSRVISVVDMGS